MTPTKRQKPSPLQALPVVLLRIRCGSPPATSARFRSLRLCSSSIQVKSSKLFRWGDPVCVSVLVFRLLIDMFRDWVCGFCLFYDFLGVTAVPCFLVSSCICTCRYCLVFPIPALISWYSVVGSMFSYKLDFWCPCSGLVTCFLSCFELIIRASPVIPLYHVSVWDEFSSLCLLSSFCLIVCLRITPFVNFLPIVENQLAIILLWLLYQFHLVLSGASCLLIVFIMFTSPLVCSIPTQPSVCVEPQLCHLFSQPTFLCVDFPGVIPWTLPWLPVCPHVSFCSRPNKRFLPPDYLSYHG